MSDRFPTRIQIGGQVKRGLLPGLIKTINAEGLHSAWDAPLETITTEEELLRCVEESRLQFYDDAKAWGEFAELEFFLAENQIPFDRSHGPHYEISGEIARFRPVMESPACGLCDDSGTILVEIETVREARNQLKACRTLEDTQKVIQALDELCALDDIEPLPVFEIVD